MRDNVHYLVYKMKQLLITLGLIAVIGTLLFYIFQRHLIYFPSKTKPRLSDYHIEGMRLETLHTKDKIALNSWYKPAKPHQATVLLLHGNAGHMGNRMALARQFIQAGLGVFLLEYRGYGGNKGTPTEQGFYEDARTAVAFLHQAGIANPHLVLYGESLGTGVATQLAVEYPVCAVVLQSPYTSLVSLGRHHYPWLLLQPWDKYDSLSRIKKIQAPLLVLHGKEDTLVPFDEGLRLFNAAKEPKKMVSFDHKGHNDLWDAPGFSEAVLGFIRTHCLRNQ